MDAVEVRNIFPPQTQRPRVIVPAPFLPKGNVLIYLDVPPS